MHQQKRDTGCQWIGRNYVTGKHGRYHLSDKIFWGTINILPHQRRLSIYKSHKLENQEIVTVKIPFLKQNLQSESNNETFVSSNMWLDSHCNLNFLVTKKLGKPHLKVVFGTFCSNRDFIHFGKPITKNWLIFVFYTSFSIFSWCYHLYLQDHSLYFDHLNLWKFIYSSDPKTDNHTVCDIRLE